METTPVKRPYGVPTLAKVTKGFVKLQKDYLFLRLLDYPKDSAAKIAVEISHSNGSTPEALEKVDKLLGSVDNILVRHKEFYIYCIADEYRHGIGAKGIMVLNRILDAGMDWARQGEKDKIQIVKVLEILTRMQQMELKRVAKNNGREVIPYEDKL